MRKYLLLIIVFIASLSFTVFSPPTVSAISSADTNIVTSQAASGSSLGQNIADHIGSSLPWYVVRGSGIIAAIALTILMISGIGMINGHVFKFIEPLTAWVTHKTLGIVLAVSMLLHMAGLLFDKFIAFSPLTLFIPWLSDYRPLVIFGIPLGSLFVALGVLAFYLIVIIVVVSLLWTEKKPRLWKLTHLLSYLVMAFVFIHALYLGTDLAGGWTRWLWIGLGIIIATIAVVRLQSTKSL